MTLSPPGDTPHLTLSPARAMSRSRTSHIALKRRAQAPVLSVGRAGVTPVNAGLGPVSGAGRLEQA